MKRIINFLTMINLLTSMTLTVNACDNDPHYGEEITAISNNIYILDIKAGITREYLFE